MSKYKTLTVRLISDICSAILLRRWFLHSTCGTHVCRQCWRLENFVAPTWRKSIVTAGESWIGLVCFIELFVSPPRRWCLQSSLFVVFDVSQPDYRKKTTGLIFMKTKKDSTDLEQTQISGRRDVAKRAMVIQQALHEMMQKERHLWNARPCRKASQSDLMCVCMLFCLIIGSKY